MKLTNEFEVAVPADEVWPALLDIERVARFLPGAEIEASDEPGVYNGTMRVKLGPMIVNYRGTARLGEVDEEGRSAAIDVEAREARGQGRAAATIVNRLTEEGGSTRVAVETDLKITGRQAQFGRGIMEDVAGSMLGDFARRFEASLLEEAGAREAGAAGGEAAAAGEAGDEAAPGEASAAGAEGDGGAATPAGDGAKSIPATPAAESSEAAPVPPAPDVLDVGAVVGRTKLARYGVAALAAAAGLLLLRALRRR